ncbi:Uncharacterised protein [Bordetella pertussis]|nr:Uncharacterised protein [Bordetella pertussis]
MPGMPRKRWSVAGIAPRPIRVLVHGAPVWSTRWRKASAASDRITPPPV